MEELEFDECPACESKKIRHKRGGITHGRGGREVRIPRATYWECDACREQFYTMADMRRIEEYLDKYPGRRKVAA
ncbi:YgiT-type zinc finger protein [bacterium]|nr:YgiT-type zinc finger protein [bacterium]